MSTSHTKKYLSFDILLDKFISEVESLRATFPLVIKTLSVSQEQSMQKLSDFLEPLTSREESDGQLKITVKVESDKVNKLLKLRREYTNFEIVDPIIKRSFIVSLISQFDTHLSRLIRTIFYLKPEILNSSEKTIKFIDLIEFNNIESAREYIIEKEIESVLRESHTDHFKWLENKLGFKTLRDLQAWATFIEITERRNLFVHCDGLISSQYLKVCQENTVKLNNKLEVGKRLEVNEDYFNNAYQCIFEIGVKLVHTIWRKLIPDERDKADNSLINLSVNLIGEEEYKLANIFLNFASEDYIQKHSSQKSKILFLVNKAQVIKWEGNEQEARKVLDSIEWSALSNNFKLARAVLIDDFELAQKIMFKIGNDEETISRLHYREWPIFKEFRKSNEFLEAYEKIYNEPFMIVEETSSILENSNNN
jgi:hypothetical protein